MIRAAAKNHERRRGGDRPRPVRAGAGGAAARRAARCRRTRARGWPSRRSGARPSTTRRSPPISRAPGRAGGARRRRRRVRLSRRLIRLEAERAPRSATARTRTSGRASTGRSARRSGRRPRRAPPAPRPRALVQQPPRLRRRRWACSSSSTSRPPSSIKHTNPCGAALGPDVARRRSSARAPPIRSRSTAASSGSTGPVDSAVVEALAGILLEILFAPGFEPDALEELRRTKKKCRVFEVPCGARRCRRGAAESRSVLGRAARPGGRPGRPRSGAAPRGEPAPADGRRVARAPLRLAGGQARQVQRDRARRRSEQVVGVGAGQMNRVDSARLAVMRARELGHEIGGAAVCARTRSSRSATGSTSSRRRAPPR